MGRYPLRTWIGKYMTAMEPYYAPSTLKVRRAYLNVIERDYASLRENDRTLDADPIKWGERELTAIMSSMRARELTQGTQTQHLGALKLLLDYVGNSTLSRMRAKQRWAFPKANYERKSALAPEDLETVLASAREMAGWTGECASFCLAMYAYTGIRKGELLSAHRVDLDILRWTFKVRHPKGERTYGKQRVVPVPEPARERCIRYLKAREVELGKRGVLSAPYLMFSMRDSTKPLHPSTVDRWTKSVSERTSIPVHPHMLRRTYGQLLLDDGASIESVSLMLGHASTLITERHYCRKNADDAMADVLKAFDQRHPSVKPTERRTVELISKTDLPGYA